MGWFTNIEKMAAHKLKDVFMSAKKVAEHAGDDVVAAQHALDLARQKAADLSAKAHAAAIVAANKAQAEADALVAEAKAAGAKALFHAQQSPVANAPLATPDVPVVAVAPVPVANAPLATPDVPVVAPVPAVDTQIQQ